jgi:hypothetical protein
MKFYALLKRVYAHAQRGNVYGVHFSGVLSRRRDLQ